ncbi:reverse transcriptase [Orientia tsutsugamushi]|nr:reverse transcriptase [Orientia tsutsugamushi]
MVLPKRLNKYRLNINEAKSQMIKSGRDHAANLAKQGKKISSYNFLGFTCYWSKSRFGTIVKACKIFNISRNTIYRWKHRKCETGDIKAKPYGPAKGYNAKIDLKEFEGLIIQSS